MKTAIYRDIIAIRWENIVIYRNTFFCTMIPLSSIIISLPLVCFPIVSLNIKYRVLIFTRSLWRGILSEWCLLSRTYWLIPDTSPYSWFLEREIWLSPMTKVCTPADMSKGQSDNTNNATKKFDYTAVADRLRTSVGVPTATKLVWLAG